MAPRATSPPQAQWRGFASRWGRAASPRRLAKPRHRAWGPCVLFPSYRTPAASPALGLDSPNATGYEPPSFSPRRRWPGMADQGKDVADVLGLPEDGGRTLGLQGPHNLRDFAQKLYA